MRIGSRTLVACALGLSGLLAVACDEPMVAGDASTDPMMDGGGGGGGDDGGGGGNDDGGGTTPGGDCASEATAFCQRYQECNPNGFIGAFENMSICVEVRTEACETATPIPLTNGLADEDACQADQIASCEGLLGRVPAPAACTPVPGEVTTVEGACFTDAQCGVATLPNGQMRQMYCRPLMRSGGTWDFGTAECPQGQCVPAVALGSTCNPANQGTTQFCDRYAGQACAQAFEDSGAGVTGTHQCRQIEYGTDGDECAPGSNKQCASGFVCHTGSRRCMAARGENAACDPGGSLCDSRLGLSCRDVDGAYLCARSVLFVQEGAQCNHTEDGVTQVCSPYARCKMEDATPTCELRRRLGQTCTASPDNCWPGLECRSGTCQEPEPGAACD